MSKTKLQVKKQDTSLASSEVQMPRFLSYVEYRPNTNIEILYKTGHPKGRPHSREGGEKKEIKKVNMSNALSIQERIWNF
jgi:hypothetical protein